MSECLQGKITKGRNLHLEYVENNNTLFSNNEYKYKLSHTYDIEPSPIYVKSNIDEITMETFIMYMQCVAWKISQEYALGQEEVVAILRKLYGAKIISKHNALDDHFDLYENWERFCGVAERVENVSIFASEYEKIRKELLTMIPKECHN